MYATVREITLLKACAWCKDLQKESAYISSEDRDMLLLCRYLRKSKNGLCIHVTEKGYRLLEDIGYSFEKDTKPRTFSSANDRRLQVGNLMLFLSNMGVDIFMKECDITGKTENAFLPSFALRRESHKNLLGTTRFVGMLYDNSYANAVYFLSRKNDGLYPQIEKETFTMRILCGNKKPRAVFTGEADLKTLIHFARNKTTGSRALSFMEAAEGLDCPVAFVPMNGKGMRQLRIIGTQGYKEKLLKAFLCKKYEASYYVRYDATEKGSGKNYIVGIDLDIPRMVAAADFGTNILLLDWQVEVVKSILAGKEAVLYPVSESETERVLKIPNELPEISKEPYKTKKGEFLSATV